MAQSITKRHRFLVLVLLLASTGSAWADAGKDLFEKQCASCHTIGGGDGGGPDLKGVGARHPAAWLVRVIAEPDKLTAEKDPAQLELVKKCGNRYRDRGARSGRVRALRGAQGGTGRHQGAAGNRRCPLHRERGLCQGRRPVRLLPPPELPRD